MQWACDKILFIFVSFHFSMESDEYGIERRRDDRIWNLNQSIDPGNLIE